MTDGQYLDALVSHAAKKAVREGLVEPTFTRLLRAHRGGRGASYDEIGRTFRRLGTRIAADWAMEHGSIAGTGLTGAAEGRQIDLLADALREDYLARRRA